jgi:tetratricopeptide (TPR) repeat protein
MSKSELECLKTLIDQLVVVKSILSTSTSKNVAKVFLSRQSDPQTEKQLESVLFEIDADPQLNGHNKKPFANVTNLSNFDIEEEVLFMFGSVFLLTGVYPEDDIWIIKMSLWTFDETELQPVLDILGNIQTNLDDNQDLLSFILILISFDKDDLAEKLVKRYLLELTWDGITNSDDTIEIAKCYHQLGYIDLKQGQYDSAIEWLNKALEMFARTLPVTHLCTAATHMSIGDALTRKGDMKQARLEYQTALRIYERDYNTAHPKIAACRENIVWHIGKKQQPFRRPIDFSQPSIEIDNNHLSTIQTESFINVLSKNEISTLNSLSMEDILKQINSIVHSANSNTTDEGNSTRRIKLHPLVNTTVTKHSLFPFVCGIVTYRCPSCKEPVWVYRLFSMVKGSPCFRCIGKALSFRRK